MNTLCESEVLAHKVSDNPDMAHIEEGIKIKPVNVGAYPPPSSLIPQPSTRPLCEFKYVLFENEPRLTEGAELEEDGVRIALTIVDTPGFGDNIDNEFA